MQPASSEDATRAELRRLLADRPDVELRPLFGSLAALVGGQVFAVALGDHIGVKLDAAGLEELGGVAGSQPLLMGTRRMNAYRSLPADLSDSDRTAWLDRAKEHVAMLSPKARKPRSARP